jgi:hypothetical protein
VWIGGKILKIRKKIKIYSQIHTQKLFLILNYLIRNLQICKILKPKLGCICPPNSNHNTTIYHVSFSIRRNGL